MHQFLKFILSWNSACFGQFVCPSSGVYSLYTQQWYMSYRFVDSCRAGAYKPVWHMPLLSVQWINSWWWTEELSETCRVSWQNKFEKLVHLVGFITKKFALHVIVILHQACQTEGPPRAIWVTFVLSWGPHTTTKWSHLIKIIAEYFYYLNLETYNVHSWMQSNVV